MKVLLTGATGYIGRRLKKRLLKDPELTLRLLVIDKDEISDPTREYAEIIEGSTFDEDALKKAVDGIDTAYYLIHSMGAKGDFPALDRKSATNFINACIEAGVRRVIYLGGLGIKETASEHLMSRIETGEILSAHPDKIQTLWFRAGIIIGSGSASFEIIRNLVHKLPVLMTPKWVRNITEPIGINDVIDYLYRAVYLEVKGNQVIDIGSEKMSFREMMLRAAKVMGLKRSMIPVPMFTPRLSSYWLILLTPVPYGIAAPLVEGLKSETVKQNDNAARLFPDIVPAHYEETVQNALNEIEHNQVVSCWSDSTACDFSPTAPSDIDQAVESYSVSVSYPGLTDSQVFHTVRSIGGENGWFRYHFLWEIRGLYDKLTGGYGLNRGRRDPEDLRVGDSVDFWRVIDLVPDRRLLLFAQMRLPGDGWLEFTTQNGRLTVTAHFMAKGLWGRIYWFAFLPFHQMIFNDMATQIIKKSRQGSAS